MNRLNFKRAAGMVMLFAGVLGSGWVLAAPPVSPPVVTTTMAIAVSPTSMTPGESATVTATVTPNTGAINCGKGQIQYLITYPDTTNTGWLSLANNLDVVSNQFSAVFDSNSIAVLAGDKVSFRAGYASSGSGCSFENQAIGLSPSVDLLIVAEASSAYCPNNQTTGVYVAIVGPEGDGQPGPGAALTASFTVRVTACEDVYGVTAQGGANGWSNIKACTTGNSPNGMKCEVRNKNKRNEVYLWTIGDLLAGQPAEATVQVTGTIKNSLGECGKEKYLNGDWSALFATVSGGPRTKSAYTDFDSFVTVTCAP